MLASAEVLATLVVLVVVGGFLGDWGSLNLGLMGVRGLVWGREEAEGFARGWRGRFSALVGTGA